MSDTTQTPPADGAGTPTPKFDELRKKFEERLGHLGQQIDQLSERFAQGATEAKAGVEADLAKLKQEHQAEYEQFQKLQKVAEESWSVLQKRLDHIAHDMRSAVGQAVGQAASALGITHSDGAKASDAAAPTTSEAAQTAAQAPSDAPATGEK